MPRVLTRLGFVITEMLDPYSDDAFVHIFMLVFGIEAGFSYTCVMDFCMSKMDSLAYVCDPWIIMLLCNPCGFEPSFV